MILWASIMVIIWVFTVCQNTCFAGILNEKVISLLVSLGQGTKIFQYCTCPAGGVTYNFHSSCKHMYLSFKSIYNKEHKGVI